MSKEFDYKFIQHPYEQECFIRRVLDMVCEVLCALSLDLRLY